MKNIFTILMVLVSITFANAQYHDGDRMYGRNDDRRFDNRYSITRHERDEQIERVNFQFEARMRDLNNDRFLRPNRRTKEIERLEFERAQQIRDINARFMDRRNRFSDAYVYGNNTRRY